MLDNANSADGDQNAYLEAGLLLQEAGIPTDGKRPPLYPLLLASFAERSWAYFTWAKLVNIMLGLGSLIALFLLGSKRFDQSTALLATLLLGINIEFILHSTYVLAEALLILLCLLAWFMMVYALEKPEKLRFWLLAGIFTGLATLSKGTGPIFALSFWFSATLLWGWWLWLQKAPWVFALGLAGTSLPLWVYNTLTFGSPFYNAAINNVMWMDSAEEKYIADSSELPTIQSFLAQTSWADIWERLWDGLSGMRFMVAKTLWPTRRLAFDEFLLAGGLDLLLVITLGLALIFRKPLWQVLKAHRASVLLSTILLGAFYLLFAWYMAISPYPIRFLLPLAPPLFLLMAAAMVSTGRAFSQKASKKAWLRWAVNLLALLGILWFGQWFFSSWVSHVQAAQNRNPFEADAQYNAYQEQSLSWARQGHQNPQAVTVLWGPSHNVPTWRQSNILRFLRTPIGIESVADMEAFAEQEGVNYIIMDDDMLRRRRDLAKDLSIERLPGELLNIEAFPQAWALGLSIPGRDCRWCVFSRLSALARESSVNYKLADGAITLFAYQVNPQAVYPGGWLELNLYWRSEALLDQDYTIFTQLLGPDFQLHGQVDRQPLAGFWPSSQWQVGQSFVDKFRIPISQTAPLGTYQVLVGMYNLQSGERVSISLNGDILPDQAIFLHQFDLKEKHLAQ